MVRCKGETTKEIEIRKGVRQGCVLSPVLFNLCSETSFKEALTKQDGVEIGDQHISNVCYADDTVLISDSLGGL